MALGLLVTPCTNHIFMSWWEIWSNSRASASRPVLALLGGDVARRRRLQVCMWQMNGFGEFLLFVQGWGEWSRAAEQVSRAQSPGAMSADLEVVHKTAGSHREAGEILVLFGFQELTLL